MSELQKFKDDLEQQLVAAARRQNLAAAAKAARRSRVKPVLVVAVSMAVIVVGVFGASTLFGTKPAAADAITITELEDRVEIRVVDVVSDPDAVAAKLEGELGISAEMLAVPGPELLIGQINAVGNIGPVEPVIEVDADGLVKLVTLPVGFSGTLIIEYGRQAEPGEVYETNVTDERCSLLFGLTLTEALPQLQDLGGTLRYETVTSDGDVQTDADPNLIPGHYQLTDLTALSDASYLVTFAENPATESVDPNCQ